MNAGKNIARVFFTAFMGSALTLIAGGQFFINAEIEGATVPDWSLLDEFIISAFIAGTVAVLNYLIVLLEANGSGDAVQ